MPSELGKQMVLVFPIIQGSLQGLQKLMFPEVLVGARDVVLQHMGGRGHILCPGCKKVPARRSNCHDEVLDGQSPLSYELGCQFPCALALFQICQFFSGILLVGLGLFIYLLLWSTTTLILAGFQNQLCGHELPMVELHWFEKAEPAHEFDNGAFPVHTLQMPHAVEEVLALLKGCGLRHFPFLTYEVLVFLPKIRTSCVPCQKIL